MEVEQQNNYNELLISSTDENVSDSNEFQATYMDVIIATIITLLLPISCRLTEQNIGALIPLLMYYSCCIFVVRIRRKTFNYTIPKHNKYYWIYTMFIPLLIIIILQHIIVYNIVIIPNTSVHNEWLGTLFIWCPLNASLEQLLWVYIYDAFACIHVTNRNAKYVYMLHVLGAIMSLAFV